ncbi:NifU family protein [Steroidobacter sp. S1-65]|uniref:NifU family protein n=1 Tax=Steroidobacter gossypii TaxID=2805490 RepID=A0ABS1WVI8_9GAMM|nr:NifU family protein [Steroidobacter gossypii]MBM0104979.1 NifU family protein [Steroidobacter gossypii]
MSIDRRPTQREDLSSLLKDIASLEGIFATWDEDHRAAASAYRRAIDGLHAEAFKRLIRALKSEPAAVAAIKEAVRDEVVYAVLRHHDIIKPSVNERVEAALAGVRPMLAAHGGDVQLVAVEPPKIELQLIGACDGCAASALTFHAGIKSAIEQACPEITEVVHVKGLGGSGSSNFVSPFAAK